MVLELDVARVTVYAPIPVGFALLFKASWMAVPSESLSYGAAFIVAIRAVKTPFPDCSTT